MNKLEQHRRLVTSARIEYGHHPRKMKRIFNRTGGYGMYEAYVSGESEGYSRNPRPNPYPPGRRHDEWNRGFDLSDPMGAHHGTNI